jgi:hypothetical protein
MFRHGFLGLALATALLGGQDARACRVLDFQLTPTAGLQIAVWLEDADGRFVDTLFITQATGSYGLGNRPGIRDFNSDWKWPYGRRESVLPVWAHRRGVTYPKVVFQDDQDRDLSHAFTKSSAEPFYCRPLRLDETVRQKSIDTGSCATVAFTDKGKFDRPEAPGAADGGVSFYPPRRDVKYQDMVDSPDVKLYAMMNDLDAVSHATPPARAPFDQSFTVPVTIPDGAYVVWVEVGKEFDQNDSYRFPSPVLAAYGDYGEAYRGQPSVVWKVPVVIDGRIAHTAVTLSYAGYGDPDGMDGALRPPDATIAATTEGSGAQRLLVASSPEGMYRVRVSTQPSEDSMPPDPPGAMSAAVTGPTAATITFIEPADPTTGGAVSGYDVRLATGAPLTADNFSTVGRALDVGLRPVGPGNQETVNLRNLAPQTHYWVGIRAHDTCLNGSTPTIVELVTPHSEGGDVAWCFIATAAFGSPMQAEVGLLRRFRDQILRRQVVGEMLVESYYTFGPALAGVIRPSDTLRAVTRAALAPVVDRARLLVE